MKLFEIYLAPGHNASHILSAEIRQETGAQVFSEQEAELVGLEGIPARQGDGDRVFVACKPADERLIHTRIESSPATARFQVHQL